MANNKLKNNGKGTFFGNLLRSLVKTGKKVSPIFDAITGGKVSDILKSIGNNKELTEAEKEMLVKELEQDVIEMQEITKRWQYDMMSDSWLSKNIRPLSLAFLTLTLFIYIILDSALEGFKIDSEWVSLLGNLLMLVYGGYFGARTLEKIRHK
ncbi:MAG: hypothetical protein OET18_01030 [Desulfobacterales bacterium]|nr:hypothetical protein [Desulfobacterales bacterium]